MNFNYLKTFVIVCKSGNFTEAANKLFIPQPTVSNRISYLEEELQQSLFIKKETGKRSIALTQAGKKFLPYAQKIIDTFNNVKEELNASDQRKLLTIGSTIPYSHPIVVKKLNSLLSEDEVYNIECKSIKSSNIISEIIENKIDLAFITEPINTESIKSSLVTRDKLELVLPPNHKLGYLNVLADIDLLKEENIILFDNQLLPSEFVSQIYQHCNHVITTTDMELIKNMLTKKKAITILPSSFITENLREETNSIPVIDNLQEKSIKYYIVYDEKSYDAQGNLIEMLLIR